MGVLDVLCYAFYIVVFFQVIVYLFFYGRFAFSKQKRASEKTVLPPTSVIVYAKNQADLLQTNLPQIISQHYPEFEIVLVNNHSTDQTLEVMEQFKLQYPNSLKIVNVKNNEAFWGSKKYALTLGIKAAKYEHLLFTESNCMPASKNWIREMSSLFNKKKEIVLGLKTYPKVKVSFFNKLLRYDNLADSVTSFSFAKSGNPIKGNSENLAYTKSVFFRVNGFINHIKLPYGEANLFVNQVGDKKNTAICTMPNGFTQTKTIPYSTWKQEKQQQLKTAKRYKASHKIFLVGQHILQLLFWVLAATLLGFMFNWPIVLALFLFRIAVQFTVVGLSAKKLDQLDVLFILPFLELFLLLTQITIFIRR
ncbi:MAG: glycosyltransferase [Flavobacteriaceae bacterium]